ncbi:hypothetical protein TNIN_7191 [Trichonephila inaurata madagascariensis]|uniref:Uncharacterized protein n=1 Tax=Trichonephila inaurata madagascariensis TaxID=2747483 RepID=A0A8X6X510_9ARAC|nr:hypothetical protein TNIN_7191 [Trichonephila inaurata madagascariensis]
MLHIRIRFLQTCLADTPPSVNAICLPTHFTQSQESDKLGLCEDHTCKVNNQHERRCDLQDDPFVLSTAPLLTHRRLDSRIRGRQGENKIFGLRMSDRCPEQKSTSKSCPFPFRISGRR